MVVYYEEFRSQTVRTIMPEKNKKNKHFKIKGKYYVWFK